MSRVKWSGGEGSGLEKKQTEAWGILLFDQDEAHTSRKHVITGPHSPISNALNSAAETCLACSFSRTRTSALEDRERIYVHAYCCTLRYVTFWIPSTVDPKGELRGDN